MYVLLEDCEIKSDARGLCKKHYLYHHKYGTLDSVALPSKVANTQHFLSDKIEETRSAICRICGPVDMVRRGYVKGKTKWACGNRVRVSDRARYKYSYNFSVEGTKLSEEERNALETRQGNFCAICKSPPKDGKRLNLDHCHETGKIRGLLCFSCNSAIGLLKDDIDLLQSAIKYLSQ